MMRYILHDWPTISCLKILKLLRDAAGPSTKLIIFESVMPYACSETDPLANSEGLSPKVPYPLLANAGPNMGSWQTAIDMQVRRTHFCGVHPCITFTPADDGPDGRAREDYV